MKYFFDCGCAGKLMEISEETFEKFLLKTDNQEKLKTIEDYSKKGAAGFIIKFIDQCPTCYPNNMNWEGDFGVLWLKDPDKSKKFLH